jgi:hypothetical protein
MSRYRRLKIAGGTFSSPLRSPTAERPAVRPIERLRRACAEVESKGHSRRLFKSACSRGLPAAAARSASKIAKRKKASGNAAIGEHAIRNDADFERHVDYIDDNPVKCCVTRDTAAPSILC